jgi:hypothetical protein
VQPDYVYVIGGKECPRVKIGHSKAPEHRLNEFKTGFPYKMRVLWKCGGGLRLERALHKRFAAQHRELEWFEFGEIDPVSAVSAAASELWESGAVDGKKRAARFPTLMSLNGLLLVYPVSGRKNESAGWGRPEVVPTHDASRAFCTGVSELGTRCENPIGPWWYDRSIRKPEMQRLATTAAGTWAFGIEVLTYPEDLNRWLRQRCWWHSDHLAPAWCAPEWEEYDSTKHPDVTLYDKDLGSERTMSTYAVEVWAKIEAWYDEVAG